MKNQQNVRATISNRLSVSQEDRTVDALLPTYVKIDDRTLADRLAYIKEYAQKIVYYNKHNIADGNWEYFFLRDIAILLAVISKVELKDIEEERLRLLKAYRLASNEQERIKYFRAFFDFIISVSNQVSDWKQQITSTVDFMTEEHSGFYSDLKYLINNYFLEAYRELSDHIKKLEETKYLKESLDNRLDNVLDDVLDNKSGDDKSISLAFPDFPKKELSKIKKWEQNLLKNLNIIYKKFYKGIQKIMQVTPLYFKEALTKKYNHSPNNALYITFLHLIEQLQHQINGLSTKHLEYFYKKILHQENKVGTPDKVFVYFKLTKAFDNFFLKKGTPLKAKKNEQEITPIYKTDFDLQVTKTSIEALKTVFVSKNRYINLDSDYQLIANIYAAPIANSKDGHGLPFNTEQPKWATFGEEQLDKTSPNQSMQPATVGVVIATPILHLREGKRSIDIKFIIKKETDHNYNTFIEDIGCNSIFRF